MTWHIVLTFVCMTVVRLVGLYKAVVNLLHIGAYARVIIFVYTQCAACMFDEKVKNSLLRQSREILHNFLSNKVETFSFWS